MNYLYDYAAKVRPLIDWTTDTKETIEDFDKQWDAGQFPGWTDVNSAMKQNGAHLDLRNGFFSAINQEVNSNDQSDERKKPKKVLIKTLKNLPRWVWID